MNGWVGWRLRAAVAVGKEAGDTIGYTNYTDTTTLLHHYYTTTRTLLGRIVFVSSQASVRV